MPKAWTSGRQRSTRRWRSGLQRNARNSQTPPCWTAGATSWRGSRTPAINSELRPFRYGEGAKLAPSFFCAVEKLSDEIVDRGTSSALPTGVKLFSDEARVVDFFESLEG